MAILSSTSTLAQVMAAYDDNASYEEDGSVSKARAFITACKILLRRLPQSTGAGGGAYVSLNATAIRDEMHGAQNWLASQADTAGGAAVKAFSIERFRD